MDMNEQIDIQEDVIEEVQEETTTDVPKIDPEKTFCEQTTYLEFLLSNAKDDEEAEHIKATINNYLEVVDDEIKKDDE